MYKPDDNNETVFRFFGLREMNQYDEYIEDIILESEEIELILFIDELDNKESNIIITTNHLNNFENQLKKVKEDVLKDFMNKGESYKYISHFLKGMTDDDYIKLKIEKELDEIKKMDLIFDELNCYRSQINFGYESSFFSYDFTIGNGQHTNYVLTLVYNADSELNYIAEES